MTKTLLLCDNCKKELDPKKIPVEIRDSTCGECKVIIKIDGAYTYLGTSDFCSVECLTEYIKSRVIKYETNRS